MTPEGLLLVLADPPPVFEEEFNDWYDTEHLPERQAIPGFLTARRFTSLGDGPRYAALYDLEAAGVLESDAYRAVSGENFSPWTRRTMARAHPVRLSGELCGVGVPTGDLGRLLIVTLEGSADPEAAAAGLAASFGDHPGHLQSRVYRGLEPEPRLICVSEFVGTEVPAPDLVAFGPAARGMTLAAVYRPYRR
ncbi:MAG: hypothetical protein WBA67_00185 [Jannaschia sp.]